MFLRRFDWHLFAFLAGVFLFAWLLFVLRGVLFPFIIGFVLAYILLPLVKRVENFLPARFPRARRLSLIAAIYVIFTGILTVFVFLTYSSLAQAVRMFINTFPQFWGTVYSQISNFLNNAAGAFLPAESRQQIDEFVNNFGSNLINAFMRNLLQSLSFSFNTINAVFSFLVMPVFLFYLIKDWEKMGKQIRSWLPEGICAHAFRIGAIVDNVLGRFLRSQLLLGTIVGTGTLVALLIMGIPFAPLLAVIAGFGEMIPMLGPWIAVVVAAFVTFALVPDLTIWVIILYAGIQLIENLIFVPRIRGGFLNINPAFALVLLIVGAHLAGVWGAILILPVVATVAHILSYIKEVTARNGET